MLQIFSRRLCSFSTIITKKYDQYLNEHIQKSLKNVSTPNKIKSRDICQEYFSKLIQTSGNINTQKQCQIIKSQMNMIFSVSFQLQNFDHQRSIICEMILQQKIKSQSQLDRILKFLWKQLKINCNLSTKQIQKFIIDGEIKMKAFKEDLRENQFEAHGSNNNMSQAKFQKNANALCKKYREKYPEVDSKCIFDEVNASIKQFFDKNNKNSSNEPLNHSKTLKSSVKTDNNLNPPNTTATTSIEQNKFWDKIQNIKPRLLKQELNDPKIYEQHLKVTKGKLRFRFPPQPNGYLHIGHLKSIRMNFQSSIRFGGQCYLRYDDTNPQKQTPQFIEEIQKNIKWMGYTPNKINFTSDYFQQMQHYASQLIKSNQAYICQSSQEEIQLQRKQKRTNPFRQFKKQYSQKIFPHLQPNQTLRLKLDPFNSNPTLRDPIIYRYKATLHPKTGNRFKIYPMYDFAHCISDSIEHIDYSLCSLEFEIRRELYYRILDLLKLYKPIVWQFSRLNIKGNVISKRKIKQLIDDKKIQGWDDPRLLTIKGMQRRGYTPHMLSQFIDKINASRSGNQKYVRFEVLEKEMKKQLAKSSVKFIALKNPVKVKILQNLSKQKSNLNSCQNNKKEENKYDEKIKGHSQIYAQRQQLQKIADSKQVILKYAGVFTVQKTHQNQIQLKKCQKSVQQCKKNCQKIPILSWLPSSSISQLKVTLYNSLLNQNQQFNKDSKIQQILTADSEFVKYLKQTNKNQVFMFERIGYFKKDQKTGNLICCTKV